MLLFPKVPLILWIGSKLSTKCGRVHFEHSHRKWLVITVRPTTSVRKSPRKNLPPRNTPDLFCRCFTRQNHRCAAWAVFFFSGKPYLENFMSRLNVILCHNLTLSVSEPRYLFLRLNNSETFVENAF